MANDVITWQPVPSEFFLQPTEKLAQALLGRLLVHEMPGATTAVRIVEVEMYRGTLDKAAHSYSGRPSNRTQVMFGPPGHAYVYLIYGMYYCFNIVAGEAGVPDAILVRAGEPMIGEDLMISRRGLGSRVVRDKERVRLASGPGRLAQAMAITKQHNGQGLWMPPLYIADLIQPSGDFTGGRIQCGARINIGYAQEAQHFPWRFWLEGHPSVSAKK